MGPPAGDVTANQNDPVHLALALANKVLEPGYKNMQLCGSQACEIGHRFGLER